MKILLTLNMCVLVYVCGRMGAGERGREFESETEVKAEILFMYLFIYLFIYLF